ncbi:PEP-CTERM sorting domain-containing protein [Nostoc sp. MS1]|uniref:PEP-CTERM sorting domain-containing protein n=1 Tax=Nostoc sp. MS1 TaxID=2764711 RepID=UPI001CC82DC8|nr:PEP-CTERM sorting domain-containing protein [Nostoc sp. MS1]
MIDDVSEKSLTSGHVNLFFTACEKSGIRPTQAAIVTYGFDTLLTSGSLQGTKFPGTFSYDNSQQTGIGQEYISLTSLNFTVLGTPFTKADLSQGGQVILNNGTVDYFTAAFFSPFNIAFGFGGPGIVGYVAPGGTGGFGSGVYTIRAATVPELTNIYAPILALGFSRLIKRKHTVLKQRGITLS